MKIDLTHIRIDGGTQPRLAINDAVVTEYAEAMKEGAIFPPVVVFLDGATYWLADGFHRYHAAREASIYELEAEVRQGRLRDAKLFSAGANAAHGLRRTNEDKRRAVTLLLTDEQWGKWSDREIAERCGVSPSFVGDIRRDLSVHDGQIERERTVERGGKTYEQKTSPEKMRRERPKKESSGPAFDLRQESIEPDLHEDPPDRAPEIPEVSTYTPIADALRDGARYADVVFTELEDDTARRTYCNGMIQYFRRRAVEYERASAGRTA